MTGPATVAGVGAFFANGIGDAVLALPAIRALKKQVPEARIVAPLGWPMQVIFDEFADDLRQLPFGLRKEFSVAEVSEALGFPRKVAFFTTWVNPSLSHWLEQTSATTESHGMFREFAPYAVATDAEHYFDRYMAVTNAVTGGCELSDYAYRHSCGVWEEFYAGAELKLEALGDYWVLHPDTSEDKTFASSFWVALIDDLLGRDPDRTLVVVGKNHKALIGAARWEGRVILAPPEFALSTLIVTRAARFIGIDSCFLHYADLQGVASVGLFRKPNFARWGLRLAAARSNILVEDPADVRAIAEMIRGLQKPGRGPAL